MEEKKQEKKALWVRILRILLRVFIVLMALLLALVIALNIPAVQTFIAGRIIKSIREKTGTELSLGQVKIAIPNTIQISDLFIKDKNADTLLYMHSLGVDLDLFGLLSNKVSVTGLELENVVANIHRKADESTFNFQFLVDVFSPDTTKKKVRDTIPGKPWVINVKQVTLKNIRATFINARSGFDGELSLGDLNLKVNTLDLNKKYFKIDTLTLKNTSVLLTTGKPGGEKMVQVLTENSTKTVTPQTSKVKSIFLGLTILADQLNIENTTFGLNNTSKPRLPEGVDYSHLLVQNLNTAISTINIDSVGYRADVKSMRLSESCGFNLENLSGNLQLTDKQVVLENLQIETPESNVSLNARMGYTAFEKLLSDFGNAAVALDIRNTRVNKNDVYLFVPALATNKMLARFKNPEVLISTQADGKLNDLNLENLEVSLLENTSLKTHAQLTGLPDIKNLGFDATIDQLSTNLQDISIFVDTSKLSKLKLPESFVLKGTAKGNLNSLNAGIQLNTASGNITADAFYQNQGSARTDTFSIDFSAQHILAGTILSDTILGEFSFSGIASGSGIAKNTLSLKATLSIQEAQFNEYAYRDIKVDGRLDGKLLSATVSSADTNLNFHLIADADMREVKQKFTAQLNLAMLNLKALNFTQKDLSISTNLSADLTYESLTNSDVTLNLLNTTLKSGQKSVPVKMLNINATSLPDSIKVYIRSDLADGNISGNLNMENLQKALQSAYKKYFGIADTAQVQHGRQLAFTMDVHIPQELQGVLVPGLDSLQVNKLQGVYKCDSNELYVEIKVPKADYNAVHIDSLNIDISGRNESLAMELNSGKIVYKNMFIENLRIKEQVDKGKIQSEIRILDTLDKPKYLFVNNIEVGSGYYKLSFLTDGLILDGEPWKVEEGNFIESQQTNISAKSFSFSKGKESFGFIADESDKKLNFSNFKLLNLLDIVEFKGKKTPINGTLQGEIVFPEKGKQEFFNVNLAIDSLYVLDTLAGNLVFNIKSANDSMNIQSWLKNEENQISILGKVEHLSGTPEFDLNLLLGLNSLKHFQQYSFGALSDMSGKIEGAISLKGTSKKPELDGFIGFDSTAFRVNSLSFQAKITNEKMLFSNKGIHFDNFVIEDMQSQKLVIDGDILNNNFTDIGFDLHLGTQNFQPINSTAADNPLFFGKLSLNTDITLKGDLKSPRVQASIKIDSSTNLTYVLPGSELKLVSAEGVVKFVKTSQDNDSITASVQNNQLTDSIMSQLDNINLSANLEIDPGAKFKVDIDPKSGDYLTVSGSANLAIISNGEGKQSINGTYEVKSGLYQLSFYNLVKKSFVIAPGSTIVWSGMPMEGELNITANYTVTTPSSTLMASGATGGMSESEQNMFNQRLPYEVSLNILGFLSKPEISFNISLPEKYLLANPLIAARLAQLNAADNTASLNKQVFALLVTGTFIPDNTSTSNSPSSVASTAARNSVNGILADQMNKVSDKISYVDVNFGLTTFDDGSQSSSDTRTELDVQVSKKLFNNRVTVEAQGAINLSGNNNVNDPTQYNSGEFAATYNLTKDGEYKIKVYYQNSYDLFDGPITISGVAVTLEKEFDSLKRKKKTAAAAKTTENGVVPATEGTKSGK